MKKILSSLPMAANSAARAKMPRISLTLLGLAALFLARPEPLRAATPTWTGTGADDFWQTPANWGGTAPVTNDALFFDGNLRLAPNNNYPAGTIFNSVTFNGGADLFTLSGNLLILTNGTDVTTGAASGGGVTNSSPNAETFGLPLTLSAGRHFFEADGGGQLNISATFSRSNGATAVFNPVSGNINVTGSGLANVNDILGAWAILGNDWASLDGNGNIVAYSGYVDLAAGAIPNNAANNIRFTSDTGDLTAANGTLVNSVMGQITGAARNLTIATGGTLKLGSRGGIYRNSLASQTFTVAGGTLTANGGGEITLLARPGTASGGLTVTSIIANDSAANPVAVNVHGYVSMNAANTYSGGTFIGQGRLSGNNAASAGTGPVTVYPSGSYFFGGNVNVANNFFISGVGSTELSGNQTLGAIRFSNGSSTLSGTITLRDNARITAGATGANTISGKITGPGRLELTASTGDNTGITFNNANNDWSGGLMLTSAGNASRNVVMKLGADNQIPDGAGKGDVTLNGVFSAVRIDLNGRSDTINGLNSVVSANNQISNSGTTPSTLTVGGNNATASFGGVIQDGGTAATMLSLVKSGTGTQTLLGLNTYKGNTTVNAGTLVFGVASSFPTLGTPTVTVNSNATLDIGEVGPMTLGGASTWSMSNATVVLAPQGSGSSVTVSNLTANGATNFVGVTSVPAISTYPAQFPLIKYTTLNGALNFGLAGSLPVSPGTPYAGFISNNAANGSVDLVISGGPTSIKWAGYSSGAPNSAWDTTTPNFRTFGGAGATYSDGSFVLFDDSASNGIVTLNQTVSPAGITINNSALTYTLNDNGAGFGLTGSGSVTKLGGGIFILDNAGANDLDISIGAGTLQVGNNDSYGNLPAAGTVINNSALVFRRSDDLTVSTLLTGSGALTQNAAGTLTLGVANTFTGVATVSQGTLKVGNNNALGTTNGGTVVNGGTLDIGANAINLGQEQVTISGTGVGNAGALVNSSASTTFVGPNLARLVLAGDATVGGSGRLDLRASTTTNPNLASLGTGGLPRKLTKVGANQFTIVGVTVDPQLGDVEIQQGILGVEAATTSLGNVASNLIVLPGATLELFALTNQLNKVISIGGDGGTPSIAANSGANTIIGPLNLTNDCLIQVANGTGNSLLLSNVLTGTGILHKHNGTNTLFVAGNSPNFAGGVNLDTGILNFSGTLSNSLGVSVTGPSTFIHNGALLGAGLTNDSNSTIAGKGSSAGTFDVSGGLIPGDTAVVGTLTVGGLVVQPSAVLTYDLTTTNFAGGGSNDLIVVNGDLVINGGTVTINPIGLLQTGAARSYRLITYTGNLVWNNDLSIPDANPYHFVVDTNTTGQINLVISGGPPVWNGGSTTADNWSDPANWSGVAITPNSPLYFGGSTRLNNNNDTAADTTYADLGFIPGAGSFVLGGNPVIPGSNIVNRSSSPQTINLGLDFNANLNLDGGAGSLSIGGGLTNTSTALQTLSLNGTGILTNLLNSTDPTGTNTISMTSSNANWTLMDNAASTTNTIPWAFDIRAGTFNFGSGSSAPKLSSTTINGGPQDNQVGITTGGVGTFNMNNGTLTTVARLNTATVNVSTGIVNQVGGTLNIGQQFQGANGGTSNALSILNVSGGTLNIGSAATPNGQIYVASRDRGIFTVSSTAVVNCGNLDVSRNANGNTRGSVGTVNLDGGTLNVQRVGTALANSQAGPPSTGSNPAAAFNFNGGLLKAKQNSPTFFQGNIASPAIPITAIVKAGGANIDDGGFAISVLEPLQHDSALGATPDGGLNKQGSGTLTLTAASTYSGPTVVSNGTLAVNGSLGLSTVTVKTNGILSGTGSVTNVTVNLGGTISPGGNAAIGTLTVSNSATLQGNANMEINKTTGTNDVLKASSITLGGTLNVTNLAGTLTSGDTFKLFSASSYSGSIATGSLPALWPGLSWNTGTLNSAGVISVTGTRQPPQITGQSVSGGSFIVSGSGGLAGGTYYVVATNDVSIPLAIWPRIATNVFDASGNFSASIPIDPSVPNRFFAIQAP